MKVKVKSTIFRYGLAILLFAITIGIAILLSHYSFKINLTILIVVSLVVTAWYGGRGPGILLALLLQVTTILTEKIPPDSSIAKAYFGYFSVFSLLVFIVWLISERKHVEKGLRSSLKELADIKFALDESAIVAITDQKGEIKYVNDLFCKISGYGRDELIGQDHRIINSGHHSKEFIKNIWKTIANGRVWKGEIKNRAKDGSYYWVDTTIVPLLDNQGKPSQYVAIRYDITDRKQIEQKNQDLIKELADIKFALDESSIVAITNQKGEINFVNDKFCEISGYSRDELIGQDHRIINSGHHSKEFIKNIWKTIANGRVWKGEIKNRAKDGSYYWVDTTIVPFLNEEGKPYQYIAIRNDITERKSFEQKNQSLIKDLADIKFALDESSIVAITNQKGEINFVNDKFCEISGYSRDELIGQDHRIINSGHHSKEFIKNIWKTIANGRVWKGEIKNRAKDGSYYWVDTTIVPFLNEEGKPYQYIAIRNDITERKAAEDNILKEKYFSDVLVNSLPGIFYLFDQNGKFLRWNDNFEEVTGYSAQEINDLHPLDLFAEKDKDYIAGRIGEVFANGESYAEADLISKTGESTPFYFTGKEVLYKNELCLVGMGIDITERAIAEEEMFKLAAIVEYSESAIISKNFDSIIQSWNKGAERIFGYKDYEVVGKNILTIFPEDLYDEENDIMEKIRSGEIIYNYETVRMKKDGTKLPVSITVSPIKNKKGDMIGVSKIALDISEQILSKEELVNSEVRYRDLFENNPFPMMVYDFNTLDILAVNDAAILNYGYSREEFGEMTMLNIRPPEEVAVFLEHLKNPHGTINNFGVWKHQRKNGEIIDVDITSHELVFDGKEARLVLANDVTEKKRTEDALRESEERYRDLFENNPFPMMVYDLETLNFLAVNDAATFYYGYSEEEFLSMTIKDIRPPEDLPALLENIAQPSKVIEKSGNWRHLKKDGSIIDVEITSHELNFNGKNSRLVLANDVTEKKRAEEKLIESQKQFRELSESLPQLVWTCRGDGYCDYLSPQWVSYTGIPEKEQLGSEWLAQIYPKDREHTFKAWNKSVERKENLDVEFRIRRWDGVYRWFKTRAVPYKDDKGNVIKWFGTNTDIEESKQAEKEIRLLNENLEQRVLERTFELEVANKELESFSYSVSHDLRAPLRAIDGFSRALLEDCAAALDDEGKHYLGRVRTASQQMAQLIEDLLKLSRVTRREINRSEVNLSGLAKTISDNLKERNAERNVEFIIEEDVLAYGDDGLLRVVLENLLENAWKFTSKKEKAEITFGSKTLEDKTCYFVGDNGAGFDMTYADKLFGAFQRLHSSREFEGTGIGLATVHRILMRHGGTIRAESEIGKGTIFYFTV